MANNDPHFRWIERAEKHPGLVPVPVWYVEVEKKQVSTVLATIKRQSIVDKVDLTHIKRIHPQSSGKMRVLVATQETLDREKVGELLGLDVHEAIAARYQAATKEQAYAWSEKVWPLMWRGNPETKVPELAESDASQMRKWMAELIDEPRESCSARTLIVDAITNTVVADSAKTTSNSVLDHSVMRAIAQVADAAKTGSTHGPSYLCTDAHVYTVGEPCVMCAMALVHSRVGRVTFIHETVSHSFTGYGLHARKQLNHTFAAWQYCT